MEYKKLAVGDAFDFGAGTTLLYNSDLVDPDTNKQIHRTSLSLTTTGWVAGEGLLMRLFRDATGTGGTDDFTGDARLFFISVAEDQVSVDDQ